MRSAIYYPHTAIKSEKLLKSSLLMWDSLDYVVPWRGFESHNDNYDISEAIELFGNAHVPTNSQKEEAHRYILEMIERKIPPELLLKDGGGDFYDVYAEKILPKTWDVLRSASIAGRLRASGDYMLMAPAGLTIMSILADCCAGGTKARVTDRGDAYATISKLIADGEMATGEEQGIVPFSLEVVDLDRLSLRDLIEFRQRESKEHGNDLRDLRHRYVDHLSRFIDRIRKEARTPNDVDELRRQYADDMLIDLRALKAEIGSSARDLALSKEVVVPLVGVVGLLAATLGGATLPVPEVLTIGGGAVMLGGIFSQGNKYAGARRSIMQKHPMAYLYEFQRTSGR